jgi:hypothetical protein
MVRVRGNANRGSDDNRSKSCAIHELPPIRRLFTGVREFDMEWLTGLFLDGRHLELGFGLRYGAFESGLHTCGSTRTSG